MEKLLRTIPFSEIDETIEREVFGNEWFETKEEFEEWAGDVLHCIIFEIFDTLGIDYDVNK